MRKANKLWAPSILELRLKPDWEGAAPLYEKAALGYRVSRLVGAPSDAGMTTHGGPRPPPARVPKPCKPDRPPSGPPPPLPLTLSKPAIWRRAAPPMSAPRCRRRKSAAPGTRRSTSRWRPRSARTWGTGRRWRSTHGRRPTRSRSRGGRRRVRAHWARMTERGWPQPPPHRLPWSRACLSAGRALQRAQHWQQPLPPRVAAGGDALARGAKQLEEASPSDAHALYSESLDLYEADGKEGQVRRPGRGPLGAAKGVARSNCSTHPPAVSGGVPRARATPARMGGPRLTDAHAQRSTRSAAALSPPRKRFAEPTPRPSSVQASDVFRQAVACLVRNGKYADAATLLMRFGQACESVRSQAPRRTAGA